jgi:hypothetical protein
MATAAFARAGFGLRPRRTAARTTQFRVRVGLGRRGGSSSSENRRIKNRGRNKAAARARSLYT